MDHTTWTSADLAQRWSTTAANVNRLARTGKIPSTKVGAGKTGVYLFDPALVVQVEPEVLPTLRGRKGNGHEKGNGNSGELAGIAARLEAVENTLQELVAAVRSANRREPARRPDPLTQELPLPPVAPVTVFRQAPPKRLDPLAVCRDCGQAIFWAKSINGNPMPIDPDAIDGGNVRIEGSQAIVVKAEPGQWAYVAHQATCPKPRRRRSK